jgi:hypothetical protein
MTFGGGHVAHSQADYLLAGREFYRPAFSFPEIVCVRAKAAANDFRAEISLRRLSVERTRLRRAHGEREPFRLYVVLRFADVGSLGDLERARRGAATDGSAAILADGFLDEFSGGRTLELERRHGGSKTLFLS